MLIASPYVHSRIDSNTFTMGNPMPESTFTLCQGWFYPSVRDYGFGVSFVARSRIGSVDKIRFRMRKWPTKKINKCIVWKSALRSSASLQSPSLNRPITEECPHSTIMTMKIRYSIDLIVRLVNTGRILECIWMAGKNSIQWEKMEKLPGVI